MARFLNTESLKAIFFQLPKLSCFVIVMTYRWGPQVPYLELPVVFPYPGDIFHRTIREVPSLRISL